MAKWKKEKKLESKSSFGLSNATMLSYCLKCRKNRESKNTKVVKRRNGRIVILSKCAVCHSKKSNFFKEQEASELLNSLGIETFK